MQLHHWNCTGTVVIGIVYVVAIVTLGDCSSLQLLILWVVLLDPLMYNSEVQFAASYSSKRAVSVSATTCVVYFHTSSVWLNNRTDRGRVIVELLFFILICCCNGLFIRSHVMARKSALPSYSLRIDHLYYRR